MKILRHFNKAINTNKVLLVGSLSVSETTTNTTEKKEIPLTLQEVSEANKCLTQKEIEECLIPQTESVHKSIQVQVNATHHRPKPIPSKTPTTPKTVQADQYVDMSYRHLDKGLQDQVTKLKHAFGFAGSPEDLWDELEDAMDDWGKKDHLELSEVMEIFGQSEKLIAPRKAQMLSKFMETIGTTTNKKIDQFTKERREKIDTDTYTARFYNWLGGKKASETQGAALGVIRGIEKSITGLIGLVGINLDPIQLEKKGLFSYPPAAELTRLVGLNLKPGEDWGEFPAVLEATRLVGLNLKPGEDWFENPAMFGAFGLNVTKGKPWFGNKSNLAPIGKAISNMGTRMSAVYEKEGISAALFDTATFIGELFPPAAITAKLAKVGAVAQIKNSMRGAGKAIKTLGKETVKRTKFKTQTQKAQHLDKQLLNLQKKIEQQNQIIQSTKKAYLNAQKKGGNEEIALKKYQRAQKKAQQYKNHHKAKYTEAQNARAKMAETVLERAITPQEAKAIMQAHATGTLNSAGEYASETIIRKGLKMRYSPQKGLHFTPQERQILMARENRVTGMVSQNPGKKSTPPQNVQIKSPEQYVLQQIKKLKQKKAALENDALQNARSGGSLTQNADQLKLLDKKITEHKKRLATSRAQIKNENLSAPPKYSVGEIINAKFKGETIQAKITEIDPKTGRITKYSKVESPPKKTPSLRIKNEKVIRKTQKPTSATHKLKEELRTIVNNPNNPELTKKLLKDKRLRPKKVLTIDGQRFYMGPILNTKGRKETIMFVEENGKLLPRPLYKSNSDGGWRSSPGSHAFEEGGKTRRIYSKGQNIHYTQETKPHEKIQIFLTKQEASSSPLNFGDSLCHKHFDTKENPTNSFNKETNVYNDTKEGPEKSLKGPQAFQPGIAFNEKYRKSFDLNQFVKASNKLPRGFIPHFSKGPKKTFSIEHTLISPYIRKKIKDGQLPAKSNPLVTVETFEGILHGRKVDWNMAYDAQGRVWIDSIRFSDGKVNTYGVQSEFINSGALTNKPLEYRSQVGLLNKEQFTEFNDSYADITPLLDELVPIQEFRAARGITRTT